MGAPSKKNSFKNKKSNPVGRPKGEAGIMKEYRDRMLNSPKSRRVLETIMAAALDDEHKNQAAAWKIVVDRIVPVAGFEKIAGTSSRSSITVNISGVPGVDITASPLDIPPSGDVFEGESEVVDSGT
jgi:hypothetical protein